MDKTTGTYTLQQNISPGGQSQLQKGQKVIYEGKAAYVIAVKPVLVIKTDNQIVCGAIREHLRV